MKLSVNQKAWAISLLIHIVLILLVTDFFTTDEIIEKQNIQPVEVQFYKPPQPKVKIKKLVTKKGISKPKQAVKPTSMPGDRKQPETAKSMAPTYPKKALNNEWEGTVKVKVTVSPSGQPIQVKVISSSGHESLDKSFVRSIRNSYQFKPKRIMGKNVTGVVMLSHRFSLKVQ
tara:strand:- start:446 stop:964 length:519 start_codon:yes stop_codon:yes gene_type:complete